jgi:heme a synthase
MSSSAALTSDVRYRPGLAWFTAIGTLWVFVLLKLGAFTTSIGAGMVFPDWPLSNGSLNPEGWLTDLAMFAEHSHRLSAGVMGLLTIAIAAAIWRWDRRRWLRRMAVVAVALVLVQALVGGLRVLLDHWHVETVNTSVGRLFAMVHACLAQIYICSLMALALGVSRPWLNATRTPIGAARPRWSGLADLVLVLLVLQLGIAAVMRHSFAGLAIPTFPWSSPSGALLPELWNFRVSIHFAHRAMAVVITVAIVALALRLARDPVAAPGPQAVGWALTGLLAVQVTLGAASVLSYRNPYYTSAHVLVGAVMLAASFGLAWWARREALEATTGGDPASLNPSAAPRREAPVGA